MIDAVNVSINFYYKDTPALMPIQERNHAFLFMWYLLLGYSKLTSR